MKAQLLALWDQRTPRERILLGIAAGLALLALYAAALAPLRQAADASEHRLRRAVAEYRLMQRVRDAGLRPSAAPAVAAAPGALRQRLSEAAERDGLTLARVQPDGEALLIALDGAEAQRLWPWIAGLERAGVRVEKLSVRKSGEGRLDAQITFRGSA